MLDENELKVENETARKRVMDDIVTMLGGELIDVELDVKTLNLSINLALAKYRQRAENAVEESYMFMELKEHVNDYILPNEVVEVRQIFRRGFGISASSNENVLDPFEISFISNYMLIGTDSAQSLATYELYMGNIELAGKMFGYHYAFHWNTTTKRLKINRNIRAEKEEILLWCYNYIPEYLLFQDPYAGIWITKYAYAEAKMILGSAYEKFPSLAGPQGGLSLNGAQLKSEAIQEKAELELQLKTYVDGSSPLGFILA